MYKGWKHTGESKLTVKRVCQHCNKTWLTSRRRLRFDPCKFCSNSCRYAHRSKSLRERFWNFVDKDGPPPQHVPHIGNCWVWTGSLNTRGYGVIQKGGKRTIPTQASRASWILEFGPIPPGLYVLHRCDNPPCVRPSHLFVGTQDDNIKDAMAKERMKPRGKAAPKL